MFKKCRLFYTRGVGLAILVLGASAVLTVAAIPISSAKKTFTQQADQEAKYVFADRQLASPLFRAYITQLRRNLSLSLKESPDFDKAVQKILVEAIESPQNIEELAAFLLAKKEGDSIVENRKWHRTAILALRKLHALYQENQLPVKSADSYLIDAGNWLEKLITWTYESPELFADLLASALELKLFEPEPRPIRSGMEIARIYSEINKNLQMNPQFTGRTKEGETEYAEDFTLEGDVPFVLFRTPGESPVCVIRTPTIVVRPEKTHFKKFKVNPLFKAYLEACKKNGKKHLYVNLMRRQGKEGDRTSLIEDLESKERFKETVFVATLDRNSDFYKQEGKYTKGDQAGAFKALFLEQLFARSGHSHYYWPKSIQKEEWKKELTETLEEVHQKYFQAKSHLILQERLDFIEIANMVFIKKLFLKIKPVNATICCKHSIDRAPTTLIPLYLSYHWDPIERKLDPEIFNQSAALLFAPAILNHNRPPFKYRVERLNQALQRMF